jgi:hypothetical protein
VLARGTGRELRAKAGTDDLERAFLRFAGLDDEGNPLPQGGAAPASQPAAPAGPPAEGPA